MTSLPPRLRVFAVLTCAAGLLAIVTLLLGASVASLRADPLVYALLAAMVLAGELRPIVITRGDVRDEITVSTTFALALTLVGPLWLAVLVLVASVAVQDARARKGPLKLCFNVAQYALTLTGARFVFATITHTPYAYGLPLALPAELPAALAAGMAFFLVNNLLAGVAAGLALDVPVLEHLRTDLRFQLATSGVLVSFAPVVAAAVHLTPWLLPLLLLPIGAIYTSAKLAAQRESESLHDVLTGLPNRSLFRMRVARACLDSARDGRGFAVMLVDLDHFKEINDTLGHHVGDDLLRVVASRLADNLRAGDTVARLGGDEFAVLALDIVDRESARDAAQRLLDALEHAFSVSDVRLDVSASMGVALHPDHGDAIDVLLRQADIALYDAKEDRGTCRLYDPAADVHTPERLLLAGELRDGLDRGELFLEHQPKVDLTTGRVVGLEALVRWQHPRHGRLMPGEFLPVVENTGLIGPLTLVVLDMALASLAGWRREGHDVTTAVNLSVRHLTDLLLPQRVGELLDRHQVPASALVLEVTETLIMSDPVRAVQVLGLLRELGVRLAVDDYGTGYSSLAYLRRLHVDELKIDRSFVQHLATDEGDAVIVRSTIELGHNLGLRLVAEGVEDEPTLDLLRSWGCDLAQGYHLSRPMGRAAVGDWLSARVPMPVLSAPVLSAPVLSAPGLSAPVSTPGPGAAVPQQTRGAEVASC